MGVQRFREAREIFDARRTGKGLVSDPVINWSPNFAIPANHPLLRTLGTVTQWNLRENSDFCWEDLQHCDCPPMDRAYTETPAMSPRVNRPQQRGHHAFIVFI